MIPWKLPYPGEFKPSTYHAEDLQRRLAMIPYQNVKKWKSILVVSVAVNVALVWILVDLLWKGAR